MEYDPTKEPRLEPIVGRSNPAWTSDTSEIKKKHSAFTSRFIGENAKRPLPDPDKTRMKIQLRSNGFHLRLREDLPSKLVDEICGKDGKKPFIVEYGNKFDRQAWKGIPEQIIPFYKGKELYLQFELAAWLLEDCVYSAFIEEVPLQKEMGESPAEGVSEDSRSPVILADPSALEEGKTKPAKAKAKTKKRRATSTRRKSNTRSSAKRA